MLTSNIYCVTDTVLMNLQVCISLQAHENLITHNAAFTIIPHT